MSDLRRDYFLTRLDRPDAGERRPGRGRLRASSARPRSTQFAAEGIAAEQVTLPPLRQPPLHEPGARRRDRAARGRDRRVDVERSRPRSTRRTSASTPTASTRRSSSSAATSSRSPRSASSSRRGCRSPAAPLADASKGTRTRRLRDRGRPRGRDLRRRAARARAWRSTGPAIVETKGTTTVVHPGNRRRGRRLRQPRDRSEALVTAVAPEPITLEIIQSSLQATSDEMFAAFRKTAMSAIIYEVLDMGTAITDARRQPRLVGRRHPRLRRRARQGGEADHRAERRPERSRPGDIFVTNDPFYGGVTHLNDVVLAMPVFARRPADRLDGEHRALERRRRDGAGLDLERGDRDLPGGPAPPGREADRRRASRSTRCMRIIEVNSRLPDFLRGDLWAGIAAARVGERRLLELVERYGVETFLAALDHFMDYGEQVARRDARRSCRRGRSRSPRSRTAAQVYTVTVDDHRRRVRRRPARQPRPGPRARTTPRATAASSPRRWCS